MTGFSASHKSIQWNILAGHKSTYMDFPLQDAHIYDVCLTSCTVCFVFVHLHFIFLFLET